MTDDERQQIDQAIEQLKRRSYELVEQRLAHADELGRETDQFSVWLVYRFTTPEGAAEGV